MYSITSSPNPLELLATASDRLQDPVLRLRAAALLAIYGDNTFDASEMNRAVSAVIDIGDEETGALQALLLHLVYQTILGERRSAEQLARQLQRVAAQSPDYSFRIQGLRRAGIAFLRLGRITESFGAIRESLQLAQKLQLPLQEVACFESLACASLAQDELVQATEYATQLRKRRDAEPDFVDKLSLALETRIAWIQNDVTHARDLLSRAKLIAPPAMTRAAQTLLTIRVAAAIVAGREQEESASVRDLEVLLHRGSSFGDQDFAASVLVAAHRRFDHGAHASDLAEAYMVRRREVFPFPACYRAAMNR